MKSKDLYRKYAIRYRKLLLYRSLVMEVRKIILIVLLSIFYIFFITLYWLDLQNINIDVYFNSFIKFFIVMSVLYYFKIDLLFSNKLALVICRIRFGNL
jgi:hypothetical protein